MFNDKTKAEIHAKAIRRIVSHLSCILSHFCVLKDQTYSNALAYISKQKYIFTKGKYFHCY